MEDSHDSACLYLHGEEEVLHDDAVQVEEADDTGHPEVAGLGPQELVDPVQVLHVHLALPRHARPGGEQVPSISHVIICGELESEMACVSQ